MIRKNYKKIVIFCAAVLAMIGLNTSAKAFTIPQQHHTDNGKAPLFLEHGMVYHWTQGGTHWSHGSHQSHSSHVSHQSGY